MDDNTVIVSPMLTEKTNTARTIGNKYWFKVSPQANKIMIKKALENLFKVKVKKCNIINVKGKDISTRFRKGFTSGWKKAVVTLVAPKSGDKFKDKFDFYEGI
jgi:large subunit ribosomal protein L23